MTIEGLPFISWTKFFLIAILLAGLVLIYVLLIRSRLLNRLRNTQEEYSGKIEYLERVLIILITVVLISLFILVRPVLHGFLMVIALGLGYRPLVNILLGITLTKELSLKVGNSYIVNGNQGILNKLGWTGMHITDIGSSTFIPYRKIYDGGITLKTQQVPSMLKLKCTPTEAMGTEEAITYLRNKIFGFPFLIDETIPTIKPENNYLILDLGINNDKHLKSIVAAIENNGFNVELI